MAGNHSKTHADNFVNELDGNLRVALFVMSWETGARDLRAGLGIVPGSLGFWAARLNLQEFC